MALKSLFASSRISEGLILENIPSILDTFILTWSTWSLKERVSSITTARYLNVSVSLVDCPFRLISISSHFCLASR